MRARESAEARNEQFSVKECAHAFVVRITQRIRCAHARMGSARRLYVAGDPRVSRFRDSRDIEDDDGWKAVRPCMAQQQIDYPVMVGNARTAELFGIGAIGFYSDSRSNSRLSSSARGPYVGLFAMRWISRRQSGLFPARCATWARNQHL